MMTPSTLHLIKAFVFGFVRKTYEPSTLHLIKASKKKKVAGVATTVK